MSWTTTLWFRLHQHSTYSSVYCGTIIQNYNLPEISCEFEMEKESKVSSELTWFPSKGKFICELTVLASGLISPCSMATTRAIVGRLSGLTFKHIWATSKTHWTCLSSSVSKDIVGSTKSIILPSECNMNTCTQKTFFCYWWTINNTSSSMSIDGTMLTLKLCYCITPWSTLKSVLVHREISMSKLISWLERSCINNDILNYMWVSFSHFYVTMMIGLNF